jgi:hypothetical protein
VLGAGFLARTGAVATRSVHQASQEVGGGPWASVGWDAGLRASRLGPCAVWHARRGQDGCMGVINAEPIPAALGTECLSRERKDKPEARALAAYVRTAAASKLRSVPDGSGGVVVRGGGRGPRLYAPFRPAVGGASRRAGRTASNRCSAGQVNRASKNTRKSERRTPLLTRLVVCVR